MTRVGILHPGEMGISLAASLQRGGHTILWNSQNRSEKTRIRAEKYGLIETNSLKGVCDVCEVIICICPPHAALDVADQVKNSGFRGIYVDANAISPKKSREISRSLGETSIDYVDGGIVGGPAWQSNETTLFLSGRSAGRVGECFQSGMFSVQILGEEIGKASAIKMCYAAYTKGSTALLAAILSAADQNQVLDALSSQWDHDEPGSADKVKARVKRVTAKAWRFEGEMDEIATTFMDSNLPGGFHQAAAEVYRRIASLKDAPQTPEMEEVLTKLSRS